MSAELPPRQDIEIFSAEHVAALEQRQRKVGSPDEFFVSLLQNYGEHQITHSVIRPLSELSSLFQTQQQFLETPPHQAFYLGCLLGAEVIHIAGGEPLLNEIAAQEHHLSLDVDPTAKDEEILTAALEQIVHLGTEGYQRASEFHGLLDSWGPIVVSDDVGEHLRWGFGNMMHITEVTTFLQQMEHMSATTVDEEDLDAELLKLLEDEA